MSETNALAAPAAENRAVAREQTRMAEVIEKALIRGDLSALDVKQRVELVQAICTRERLDWLTRPFDFMETTFEGKKRTVLYARADCARQLAKRDEITLEIVSRDVADGCFVVHVRASAPARGKGSHKRTDDDLGVVALTDERGNPLKPAAVANAMKKAITQAKRRATLSICGLGLLDESEVETVAHPPEVRQVEARTVAAPALPPTPVEAGKATPQQIEAITVLKADLQLTGQPWKDKLATWGVTTAKDMTPDQANELIRDLRSMLEYHRTLQPQVGGDGLPNLPPPTGGQPSGGSFRPGRERVIVSQDEQGEIPF